MELEVLAEDNQGAQLVAVGAPIAVKMATPPTLLVLEEVGELEAVAAPVPLKDMAAEAEAEAALVTQVI